MSRLPRLVSGALATVLAGSLLVGCGAEDESADGTTTVRVAQYAGIVSLPELADALGHLDGIELEGVPVQGGPAAFQALATDQLDVASGFNGTLVKMVGAGAEITGVVANMGSSGDVDSAFVVRKDSGITGAKDLVGKKVAVNTFGAQAEAVIDTWFVNEGLSEKEIDSITLVTLPMINSETAVREKQVEAAFVQGLTKEVALERGDLVELVTDVEIIGREYNIGSHAVRDEYIEEHEDIVRTLVEGIAKASDFARESSREEVIEVYSEYLESKGRGAEVEAVKSYLGTGVATEGAALVEDDYTLWLKWLEKAGDVKPGSVDVADAFTNEYNPLAQG